MVYLFHLQSCIHQQISHVCKCHYIKIMNPQLHIEVGKCITAAISHLDNVLVLGSGFSFHNMNAFWQPNEPQANDANRAFEAWLAELLTGPISKQGTKRTTYSMGQSSWSKILSPY